MKKFVCVTRWLDDEDNAFERNHEREAVGENDAYRQERIHNAARWGGGMGADGWTWEILSVSELGETVF